MPLVYADTSALFAFFYPKAAFSVLLTKAVRRLSPNFIYWWFIRYELRHNLRQARENPSGEVAWTALRFAERTQARLRCLPGASQFLYTCFQQFSFNFASHLL
jgi:hypothetical protein